MFLRPLLYATALNAVWLLCFWITSKRRRTLRRVKRVKEAIKRIRSGVDPPLDSECLAVVEAGLNRAIRSMLESNTVDDRALEMMEQVFEKRTSQCFSSRAVFRASAVSTL